ncbi:helix-turn-helix domain-containing protein [Desulfovibrio inopinatus]|uniref:helix-turn-helix domain-containing protein n=1 Tax=Desulfovibrio inopinatus TaxID=102109 RepID=UPI0004131CC1|nr:cupin domain-containing protein [Desulfovibrio inopinatus]
MSADKIGNRIRRIREQKNITLEELSSRCELEIEFLRSLEEENMSTALGPLLKIARALSCRLGTFLDDAVSQDPLIVRLSEREESLTMADPATSSTSMRYYSLGKGKTDRHMEPFYIEIEPETSKEKPLASHQGEEFILVQSGHVELLYGKSVYTLGPGDSMYYNSVVPHYLGATSEGPASIYAVLYFPS